jgi:hypothetical protein
MSAALNFNSEPPADDSIRLWQTVSIGWEHEVDDDGNVVLTRDKQGQAIARTYTVPTHITAQQLIERASTMTDAQRKVLEAGGLPGMLEISGLLVGSDTIMKIGADPTVPTPAFLKFIEALVAGLNLTELTGGGDLPN